MPEPELTMTALQWITSTRCSDGECVQAARAGDDMVLRDSKDPTGPVLVYAVGEWRAFLASVKNGDYDDMA